MPMQMFTISRETAWKMGIDLDATGKQLKAMRRKHNLSQEELSELFEMGGDSASRVTISNWENGKKLPTPMHVVFLAELYRCSLDELVVSFRRSREAEDRGQPAFSVPCAGFPAIASAGALLTGGFCFRQTLTSVILSMAITGI